MKKWIRIKGVAAFIVITAAIILFCVLFADSLIKKAIETTGTLIVGARVELADADLTFIPAGLELTGLAVTNPDAPMTNAVEVGRMALSVETAPLFFRKWIIPEMAATGIRFDTERSRSGAVTKKKKQAKESPDEKEKSGKGLSLPSLDMKDPKKILEQETLASVEEAKKIQEDIKKLKVQYKERIAALPDDDDFDGYEKRIKKLKEGKSDWNSLQHENILHVIDFLKDGRSMFIVMEHVDGIDLYDLLERSPRLPPDIAAIIALQLVRGLDYAHFRGIIHRDIKPANIMVSMQGDVKLMDFGIARHERFGVLTETGTGLGTPSYMSPEQILGDKLDFRSDLFSVGIVLYQMLTGRKPFVEDDTRTVMQKIRLDRYTSPSRSSTPRSRVRWSASWRGAWRSCRPTGTRRPRRSSTTSPSSWPPASR